MFLNELKPPKGAKRKKKRVGRGPGSGHGKTACKGHKGQRSRSGGKLPPWFEGGQMPLQRRVPKRGFTNIFKKKFAIVNVGNLEIFEADSDITPESLLEKGLIKNSRTPVKILGNGELSKPLRVRVHKVSAAARQKIESAAGVIEVIGKGE